MNKTKRSRPKTQPCLGGVNTVKENREASFEMGLRARNVSWEKINQIKEESEWIK